MNKKFTLALVAAVLLVCSTSAATAQMFFSASLSGLQEVPPNGSPGTGTLNGTLTGGPGAWTFSYSGSFSNLVSTVNAQPSGGHLHLAPPGVNGPVVHGLVNLDTGVMAGSFSGTWTTATGLSDTMVGDLMAGNIYINIHTASFPGGEIRGQLVPEPSTIGLFAAGGAALLLAWRRKRSA
jgi:hypothetical protein